VQTAGDWLLPHLTLLDLPLAGAALAETARISNKTIGRTGTLGRETQRLGVLGQGKVRHAGNNSIGYKRLLSRFIRFNVRLAAMAVDVSSI